MRKFLGAFVAAALLAAAGSVWAKPKAVCNPADTNTATCSAIWKGIGLPAYSAAASGKTADGHDNADLRWRPVFLLQENAEIRPQPTLHVGHEEVDRVERLERRVHRPVRICETRKTRRARSA
jgi:hypothetical protein